MIKFIEQCAGLLAMLVLAACATQHPSIPPFLASALSQEHITAAASVRFQDEKGQPISQDEFAGQVRNRGFNIVKAGDMGFPDVTVRVRPIHDNPFTRLKIGDALPEFHLTRLDGLPVDNQSLKGKYTLIHFYRGGLPTPLKAVPLLNAVATRREDLNLLAFTVDSAEDAKAFVERHRLAWPVVADAGTLIRDIGENAYPATALFDPAGRLVDVNVGVGRLQYPDLFDAWLDREMGKAAEPRTAAVPDFNTCPMPIYPIGELHARHTGTVTLNFLVGADGKVEGAEVLRSSGFPGLDQAAMVSLRRCHFKPATRAGRPLQQWAPVQYVWKMQ